MRQFLTTSLALGSLLCAGFASASPVDLGPASGYNVYSCLDWYGGNHVEGYTAIANRIYIANFSLGAGVAGGDVIVVGDNLALQNGTVHGNAINDGLQIDLGGVTFADGGAWLSGVPIDFGDDCAELGDISLELAAFAVNGTTIVHPWGSIQLVGSDPDTNVFEVDGEDVTNTTSFSIDAPAGSNVLVNVYGDEVRFRKMGMHYAGVDRENVLFNFPETSVLVLRYLQFEGSVLAPFSGVQASYGNFMGTMVAGDLRGCIEYHDYPFGGGFVDGGGGGVQGAACEVIYDVVNQWPGGFQASVDLLYSGPSVAGWDLKWTFINGETVANLWNGSFYQSGADVVVSDAGWNASLWDGATLNVGFIGGGTPVTPIGFTLNGAVCQ